MLYVGSKTAIQGHGGHSRCYLYDADATDAFDTTLHGRCIGSCYNVGSVDEITNSDIAVKVLGSFGYDAKTGMEDYRGVGGR